MTDDGKVSPTGGPQEPYGVRKHEEQQAYLAASSDVGEPTDSSTLAENAGKLQNSKASVFSQVGLGFARGAASIVGAPLLIAGAIVGVPLFFLYTAIDTPVAKYLAE